MKVTHFGALTCRVVEPLGAQPEAVVFLCHGYGAPGDDLVGLSAALAGVKPMAFVFPEAPLALPGMFGARAWWNFDFDLVGEALRRRDPELLASQAPSGLSARREELLAAAVAAAESLGQNRGHGGPLPLVLGGFSQGAALALSASLERPAGLSGLLLFSGLLAGAHPSELRVLSGLPILQSHGKHDDILPWPVAEYMHAALEASGASLDFISFQGGHGIPPEALRAAATWLQNLPLQHVNQEGQL